MISKTGGPRPKLGAKPGPSARPRPKPGARAGPRPSARLRPRARPTLEDQPDGLGLALANQRKNRFSFLFVNQKPFKLEGLSLLLLRH